MNDDGEFAKSQNKTAVARGIVVAGEASESDEEEDEVLVTPPVSHTQKNITPLQVDEKRRGDSVDLSDSEPRTPTRQDFGQPKYDTLLHKKLRDKNASFRRSLCDTVGQIYLSGSKEIKNITLQLLKSQAAVQDVSHNMRLLTNDLFHLEDKIDIIATCQLLPDINITVPGDNTEASVAGAVAVTP